MNTAQELFDILRDARPATPRHSKPANLKISKSEIQPALKAIRFTVELPELGGAVSLSPWVGFEPVYCKTCERVRQVEQHGRRTFAVLPCGYCP